MMDVLRPPYPWTVYPPRQLGLRVVILIVLMTVLVVLIGCGIAPATAVAVVGAGGLAAAETANRLLVSERAR